MAFRLFSRRKTDINNSARTAVLDPPPVAPAKPLDQFVPAPRDEIDDDPLISLQQQHRFSTIIRDREVWARHPKGPSILRKAEAELEARMALVPAGSATIPLTLHAQPGSPEEETEVEPFLLDAHTVTNARYQKFVDAGGYDELDYWPEEIWPHIIELKDTTGEPAPRFWRDGRHDTKLAHHPVVGVSWFEAQAFALWVGQRLPTEAEWQMAASWHIKSSTDIMRRFPWGDSMDNTRCNIWSSRRRGTVHVSDYENGVAPNQIVQLVGNVWEWVDTEFNVSDDEGRAIIGEMPMQVVRGGAFDTYFETQATASFRTGQLALVRTHNTGFRCAMDLQEATWMNND